MMNFLAIFLFLCVGCGNQPVATRHGYRTAYVVATRLHGPQMGQIIELQFPKNPNDGDDAEIETILEKHKCAAFESGGYPGAPQYVSCEGVVDAPTATKKILEIIMPLDRLMRSF